MAKLIKIINGRSIYNNETINIVVTITITVICSYNS